MTNFEEIQEHEFLSESEGDAMSFYDSDEFNSNDADQDENSISSGSVLSVDVEDLDTDMENELLFEEMKNLIQQIINDEITLIEEVNETELLDFEDLNIMNYFQEQNNNFKINMLRVIFAKLILQNLNETINIANIKNISITLDPCVINVIGLNEEDTEKINNFFMNYLE